MVILTDDVIARLVRLEHPTDRLFDLAARCIQAGKRHKAAGKSQAATIEEATRLTIEQFGEDAGGTLIGLMVDMAIAGRKAVLAETRPTEDPTPKAELRQAQRELAAAVAADPPEPAPATHTVDPRQVVPNDA